MALPMIIVHGGAGKWKDERIPIGLEEVEKATRTGFAVLENGGTALDAAEACTVYMESCGNLNAGLGGRYNVDGVRELDAIIVDGPNLNSGAVMAVKGVQNPTSLARYVMEHTEYTQFAGEGAKRLYDRMITEGYRQETEPGITAQPFTTGTNDTVGCITVDTEGRIAVTSSTGGISKKLPGRVGDSPIFGAGAYADDVNGATATGMGEHIIRVVMCRTAVHYVEQGQDLQSAADSAMKLFEEKTGSEAGLVMANCEGEFAKATNAKAMPTAVIQGTLDSMKIFKR